MVRVQINNTKHITMANIYIPLRDSTSTHNKTVDKTSQTNHTQSAPEMLMHTHSLALIPYNTKHRHTTQSAKHHTTTNIITRYHHGV